MFILAFYLTKDMPKKYISTSTIYTGIASGSSIVSVEDQNLDLFETRIAFDNLINIVKSRRTGQEVGLRLFTSHMMLDGPDPNVLTHKSYNELMEIVPAEVKQLVVKGDFDKTYQNFQKYRDKDFENFIYEMMHLNHPHYSTSKILDKLKVSRIETSDMIELRYESDDPAICYHTLKIFNEVFTKRYYELKANQSDVVVNYFEQKMAQIQDELDSAENELLEFNKRNKIINYYEQTKSISSSKENFDREYQTLKMKVAAAESVLENLEKRLNTRQLTQIKSQEIISLRNQLADINLQIATKTYQTELDSLAEESLIEELAELRIEEFNIQEKLKNTVLDKYYVENSIEGVNNTSILQEWLNYVIELESAKAMLSIGNQRKAELETQLQNFAPLGATLKRLERKISIREREYLTVLNGLNMANLKLQNLELNSNLSVAEEAFFPIEPEPRKRKYIVLLAFLIGFIIPAFLILALDLLNQNIKNSYRAQNFTKLKVASMYPLIRKKRKEVNINYIKSKAIENLFSKLNLKYAEKNNDTTFKVAILSTNRGEGKSTIARELFEKLTSFGYQCLLFVPQNTNIKEYGNTIKYEVNKEIPQIKNIDELVEKTKNIDTNAYHFILFELPALTDQPYPVNLLKNTDQLYLVTRANRVWKIADENVVNDLIKVKNKNKPQLILNGVHLDEMESLLGELPRNRSFIRRLGKNLLTFQFHSKEKFKNANNTTKIFFFFLLPVLTISFLLLSHTTEIKSTTEIDKEISNHEVIFEHIKLPKKTNEKSENTTFNNENTLETKSQLTPIEEKFYVIGGSFKNNENAKNFLNSVKKLNFQPHFIERNNNLITVAIGIYNNERNAEQILNKYKKINHKTDAWILKDYFKIIQPDNK